MANRATLIYVIFLGRIMTGCYEEPHVTLDEIILDMRHAPDSTPADGVSRTLISVMLPNEATDATNSVVFTTTKGAFDIEAKNTVTVSAQNVTSPDGTIRKIASIYLTSPIDESEGFVTATVRNYTRTDSVKFIRAYPDSIKLRLDKLVYNPDINAEIAITAQIKRNLGKGIPSQGQIISLVATDNSGHPVGTFRNKNVVTDSNGICVNHFSIEPGNPYTGLITIRASVTVDKKGTRVSEAAHITVIH